ncbi:hypothetical protein CYY_007681 [Polysphondylium violaceum]|uniref:Histone deacetylase domain-containing protein n=1 Tax=Polysphondylium violaceum TaxID=133409 RepID=A0A8J4PN69_9MYCE|nr:hypothetical protein CYY_007681 [Polysphondylium violaceum]
MSQNNQNNIPISPIPAKPSSSVYSVKINPNADKIITISRQPSQPQPSPSKLSLLLSDEEMDESSNNITSTDMEENMDDAQPQQPTTTTTTTSSSSNSSTNTTTAQLFVDPAPIKPKRGRPSNLSRQQAAAAAAAQTNTSPTTTTTADKAAPSTPNAKMVSSTPSTPVASTIASTTTTPPTATTPSTPVNNNNNNNNTNSNNGSGVNNTTNNNNNTPIGNKRQRFDSEQQQQQSDISDSEDEMEEEEDEDEEEESMTNPTSGSSTPITKPGRGRPRRQDKKILQLQQYLMATQGDPNNANTMNAGNDSIEDNEDLDDDDMGDDKKKKSSKIKKPSQLDIRPCWFTGCIKADRSLKILRPCLVPTCKTHAIKSEARIYEALKKGEFQEEEANGIKDLICGICGENKPDLKYCANDNCAFGFCDSCADITTHKHGSPPNGDNWVCWVCTFVKSRGRERERKRWVKEQTSPSHYGVGRKRKDIDGQGSGGNSGNAGGNTGAHSSSTTSTPTISGNKRIRKKINTIEPTETRKYTKKAKPVDEESRPTSPLNTPSNRPLASMQPQLHPPTQQNHGPDLNANGEIVNYESILSPEKEQISAVDFFIDQAYNAVKFFSSLASDPPAEVKEHIDNFSTYIMRIKTVRWSSDYSLVWRMIEDLSNIIRRNLISSQSIIEMQKEMSILEAGVLENSSSDARNVPLERAISMVFENHETAGQIGKECCSTRNSLYCSIEMAHRSIAEHQRDLELFVAQEENHHVIIAKEIDSINEQIKINLAEIHKLKFQEAEIFEQLSKVRSAIAAHESVRDTYTKKTNDLKIDLLVSRNNLSDKEKDTGAHQATLENEIYALKLLIKLIEGLYWIHDHFYVTKVGEAEKVINSKLGQLQKKIKHSIPSQPPSAEDTEAFKTIAIYHKICMQHNVPNFHLEKPDRIKVTVNCIHEFAQAHPDLVDIIDNPAEVDMRYVMAVHDAHYIKKLETSLPPENSEYETHLESDQTGAMVTVASHKDCEGDDETVYDTFVSHRSMKAALRASGSVCAAVDQVTRRGYTRAFCAIRPPGHHAGRYGRTNDAPSQGYCLINNVAIGAKYASLTAGYSRIAVVDFDVHHGNGTQEILSGDDNFLFISIHVCDDKRYFYPGTGKDQGDIIDESTGSYEGNILNIGLKRNSNSSVFLQAWMDKIIPRLEAYKPQLIFLSAGFDGHKDDPTNGLKLHEEDYYVITKMVKTVAFKYSKGRIISVLEGGYGIENKTNSLQRCVNSHLRALINDTEEEVSLANSCYGMFKEDLPNLSDNVPKFNINNFISNASKRGKKTNLNTINFISNNMNSINNTISNRTSTTTTTTTTNSNNNNTSTNSSLSNTPTLTSVNSEINEKLASIDQQPQQPNTTIQSSPSTTSHGASSAESKNNNDNITTITNSNNTNASNSNKSQASASSSPVTIISTSPPPPSSSTPDKENEKNGENISNSGSGSGKADNHFEGTILGGPSKPMTITKKINVNNSNNTNTNVSK